MYLILPFKVPFNNVFNSAVVNFKYDLTMYRSKYYLIFSTMIFVRRVSIATCVILGLNEISARTQRIEKTKELNIGPPICTMFRERMTRSFRKKRKDSKHKGDTEVV